MTSATLKLPEDDEGEEDDDQEDDGDGDAHQDGRVVRVCADGLRPRGLAELAPPGVGADLNRSNDDETFPHKHHLSHLKSVQSSRS